MGTVPKEINKMSKYTKIVTPVGTAVSCYINSPSTTFDERGTYNLTLSIPKADAGDLMATLDAAVDASYDLAVEDAKPAVKKQITKIPAYEPEYDEAGEETGNILVKSKQIATFQYNGETVDRIIAKYDSTGRRCDDMEVGNGSKITMCISLNNYFVAGQKTAGVSRYLTAVKIVDLVEIGESDPFGDVGSGSNGFVAPPPAKTIQELKDSISNEKLASMLDDDSKPAPDNAPFDVLSALGDL